MALPLLGPEIRVPRIFSVHSLLVIRVQEGKSEVTQVVSYISYSGLFKRGISWRRQPGSVSYFTSSCVIHYNQKVQCQLHYREDFQNMNKQVYIEVGQWFPTSC